MSAKPAWFSLFGVRRRQAERQVWLTFDDGPDPAVTPKILDSLDRQRIGATFFVVGQRAEKYPDIVRRAFSSGHRIGNHTFSHPNLCKLSNKAIFSEIIETDRILIDILGSEKLFRPPYGARNARVDEIASKAGYRTVLWNVSTRDWHTGYQSVCWAKRGRRLIVPEKQSVVLMHDTQPTTARFMDDFLALMCGIEGVRFMSPETLGTQSELDAI